MGIVIHQEDIVMRNDIKDNKHYLIIIFSVCFLLCVFELNTTLYAAGEIVGWGANFSGQCTVPEPNTGFKAIAAGFAHSLGLKTDGSIVAWGGNYYGECNVPEPNTDFMAIAAELGYSLGLKQDGSIVGWGINGFGVCNVPSPNTGFIAIAAGQYHSLGLKQDGSIVAWGEISNSSVPEPNTGFMAIAAGRYHSIGLKGCLYNLDGDLYEDCRVNFYDLAIMGDRWLADYDMYDLETLASDWLIDCFEDPSNPACVYK